MFNINKPKKTVSLKRYNEMKEFFLSQIKVRDERIKKLKEEKQIMFNMAMKKSEEKLKNATRKNS